jgi:hypothetical protein
MKTRIYTKEDIKIINPDEHVLNNPSMYWGTTNPSSIDFINGVKNQLKYLNDKKIKTLNVNGWYIIGSKFDWIQSGLVNGKSEDDLFNSMCGYSDSKGATGVRVENLIRIYIDHVLLWRNNKINQIKGGSDNVVIELIKDKFYDYVTLAFKVDKKL